MRRTFVTSGELENWVQKGLRGVTSNPSIFDKAIAGSTDYDDDLDRLVDAGKSVQEIYEALAIKDIQLAADVLLPVYHRTQGKDGYVSLEVRPSLANDTQGTIEEARRLFATLDRPNVMIKVPATSAGIPAIEALVADGLNINVTLLFSISQYEKVAEAYLSGLESLMKLNGNLGRVASVASFFVSRVDRSVDQTLEKIGERDLLGKIAIANAKVVYARFQDIFSGSRWERLSGAGAQKQRLLWASTSTKNPAYPDTLYVDQLMGPDTVNTIPPATLEAFIDHGLVSPSLMLDLDASSKALERLDSLGVDLEAVTEQLQIEGVAAFAESFDSMLKSITIKRAQLHAAP
jgi:transaldolase